MEDADLVAVERLRKLSKNLLVEEFVLLNHKQHLINSMQKDLKSLTYSLHSIVVGINKGDLVKFTQLETHEVIPLDFFSYEFSFLDDVDAEMSVLCTMAKTMFEVLSKIENPNIFHKELYGSLKETINDLIKIIEYVKLSQKC